MPGHERPIALLHCVLEIDTETRNILGEAGVHASRQHRRTAFRSLAGSRAFGRPIEARHVNVLGADAVVILTHQQLTKSERPRVPAPPHLDTPSPTQRAPEIVPNNAVPSVAHRSPDRSHPE